MHTPIQLRKGEHIYYRGYMSEWCNPCILTRMKQTLVILFILTTLIFDSLAQFQLSERAEIHVITAGPYQPELYSAFGHSAIRVNDPARGIDLLYNYGIFDFDQPNFYLNFARGFLHYKLGVSSYTDFRDYYIYYNRFLHEQVLNLTPAQKQELFDFLQWNALPENQFYFYDYFYDNCATRVRDALKTTFGTQIRFDGSYIDTKYTIRDLTDIYLQEQPWGDLGIDLGLGLPIDKVATPEEYMFLPDYIEAAFNHAYIMHDGKEVPLVKETLITYSSQPEPDTSSVITPVIAFSILLLIGIIITWIEGRRRRYIKYFDVLLFFLVGCVGWVLLLLWIATDHNAASNNFNLLWAIPLYFPLCFWLLKRHIPEWIRNFFFITSLLGIITIISWTLLPQDLPDSVIPLIILMIIRGMLIARFKAWRSN